MPSFTVVQADHKKDFDGNRGPMSVYALVLNNDKGETESAELCQMQKTAPPQAGQTIDGHIEPSKNPEFAPSFKKDYGGGSFSGGGGGGSKGGTFKPRDPSEIAGARHAHNLLVAAHNFPPLEYNTPGGTVDPKHVQQRLDDLEAFACVLDERTAAISDAAKQGAEAPKKGIEDSVPF